jgi:hypothetical protein
MMYTRTERELLGEPGEDNLGATLINDKFVTISRDDGPDEEDHRWISVTVHEFDLIARALGYDK